MTQEQDIEEKNARLEQKEKVQSITFILSLLFERGETDTQDENLQIFLIAVTKYLQKKNTVLIVEQALKDDALRNLSNDELISKAYRLLNEIRIYESRVALSKAFEAFLKLPAKEEATPFLNNSTTGTLSSSRRTRRDQGRGRGN